MEFKKQSTSNSSHTPFSSPLAHPQKPFKRASHLLRANTAHHEQVVASPITPSLPAMPPQPAATPPEAQDITLLPTMKLMSANDGTHTPPNPGTWSPYNDTRLSGDLTFEEIDQQLIPDLETYQMSTIELMQISSVLQAVRSPQQRGGAPNNAHIARPDAWSDRAMSLSASVRAISLQPTLHIPVAPSTPAPRSGLKALLGKPVTKILLGGLIGIAMLVLVSRSVNIPNAIAQLKTHLTTTQGILFAALAALSFIFAFSVRASRWNLFLRPTVKISVLKSIQIYWVGVFINVLLPVQGGELTKSLLLKRITGVPVSQSLPTVAMDKSLDLMPALFIMAIVPFIPGIHMNLVLWAVLALVSGILLGIIFVVGLTVWNRTIATRFIQFMVRLLPGKIGAKIESFAMGFVDSLLAGASRPRTFIPAIILTCLALSCDGLFALFAFWAVGLSQMNFGTAIFGYTFFNMFTILPTPPGQVGWNELIGKLVFGDLLGFDKTAALNMFLFSHPLTALIMATMCMLCLSGLGLTISNALKSHPADEKAPAIHTNRPVPLPGQAQTPTYPTQARAFVASAPTPRQK